MSVFVVTDLLLLLCNVECNLDSLGSVAEGSIKLERVLWLLRNVISLAHKVVHELVSESVELGLCDHVDHIRDAALTLLDVQFQSLVGLLALLVVLCSAAPLRLAFEVLGDA